MIRSESEAPRVQWYCAGAPWCRQQLWTISGSRLLLARLGSLRIDFMILTAHRSPECDVIVPRLPMHASRSLSQLLGQGALQGSGSAGARGGGHARRHSRQTASPRSAVTVTRILCDDGTHCHVGAAHSAARWSCSGWTSCSCIHCKARPPAATIGGVGGCTRMQAVRAAWCHMCSSNAHPRAW